VFKPMALGLRVRSALNRSCAEKFQALTT